MAENSAIEWTHHTFNPWWGCVKVSPACTHCYAATFANRFGVEWGPKARRRFFGDKKWREPLKWDSDAKKAGERRRVFCASMADVFEYLPEDHPDSAQMDLERGRLWALIEETPNLDWLLLTKRPENVTVVVPDAWLSGFPPNVWVGMTVENQQYADECIPALLQVPAPVRFISAEPLLGLLDLRKWLACYRWWNDDGRELFPLIDGTDGPRGQGWWIGTSPRIDWVIAGGESGPGARPAHPDWLRSLRDQCGAAGVPFFFKQWGEFGPVGPGPFHVIAPDGTHYRPGEIAFPDGPRYGEAVRTGHDQVHLCTAYLVGKKTAGRLLDGREWSQFPEVA